MKRFPIVGLAVSLTLLTGTAVAQDSEGLEEIVVTATKREQTLQDVPVAVSVTTVETINKASIQDVSDLASIIPSLRVTTLQTSTNTNFIIRGFGNGANNPGIEPSVGVFIDGVYRSRSAGAIGDLIDVSRVEVLRGPQSTLFGQNASAGVISVITQKPQFESADNPRGGSGLIEATIGNYNQRIIKGKLTGPISETVAYSLTGVLNQRDGYFLNQRDSTDFNNRDRWDLRGQLLWKASDSIEVRFIADASEIDEVCCGVANLVNGPTGQLASIAAGLPQNRVFYPGTAGAGKPFDRAAYLNKKPVNVVENSGISMTVDWEVNDSIDFTSITAMRGQKTDFDYDFDFTGALLGTVNRNIGDIDTFTQEFRVSFDNGGRLRGLLGAYLMQEDLEYSNEIRIGDHFRSYASLLASATTGPTPLFLAGVEQQLAPFGPTLAGSISPLCTGCTFGPGSLFRSGTGNLISTTQDTEANTFFGQLDFDLTDRLTATVGLAHTSTDKVIDFKQSTNELFSSINLVALGFASIQGNLLTNPLLAPLRTAGLLTPAVAASIADRASVADGTRIPCVATGLPGVGSICNTLLGFYALQFLHPIVPYSDRSEDSEETYTVRLAYEASDAVSVYGGVSTGYKATSWNLSRDSKDPFAGTAGLSPLGGAANPWYPRFGSRKALPEKSTVVELGLKARWDSFAVNLAVFDQNIKDFQTNLFTGTGFNLANAGKQSTKGVEIETQWKLNSAWQIDFAGTFLDPKYDSFKGAEGPSGPVDLSGLKPAGIHEQSMSLGVNYLWSLGSVDGFVRTDYLYESGTQIAENVAASVASREVNTLNASIGFKAAGFDVLVWGRNLNDDEYLLSAFPAVAQAGSFSGYPNQPRTYGVTLRKEF
ncbi:MAG: TonB-dependent receptor [Gammaproteobacteria bacterium]